MKANNGEKYRAYLEALNRKYGLPPGYLFGIAGIESNYNPNAVGVYNPDAKGMFQFTSATAKLMGLKDRFNWKESADAAARLAIRNRDAFAKSMNIDPASIDLQTMYMLHQQGHPNTVRLYRNPNKKAVDLIGSKAVLGNLGTADMTGQAFINHVRQYGGDKFQLYLGDAYGSDPSLYPFAKAQAEDPIVQALPETPAREEMALPGEQEGPLGPTYTGKIVDPLTTPAGPDVPRHPINDPNAASDEAEFHPITYPPGPNPRRAIDNRITDDPINYEPPLLNRPDEAYLRRRQTHYRGTGTRLHNQAMGVLRKNAPHFFDKETGKLLPSDELTLVHQDLSYAKQRQKEYEEQQAAWEEEQKSPARIASMGALKAAEVLLWAVGSVFEVPYAYVAAPFAAKNYKDGDYVGNAFRAIGNSLTGVHHAVNPPITKGGFMDLDKPLLDYSRRPNSYGTATLNNYIPGWEEDEAKRWLGLAIDVFGDPLIWMDFGMRKMLHQGLLMTRQAKFAKTMPFESAGKAGKYMHPDAGPIERAFRFVGGISDVHIDKGPLQNGLQWAADAHSTRKVEMINKHKHTLFQGADRLDAIEDLEPFLVEFYGKEKAAQMMASEDFKKYTIEELKKHLAKTQANIAEWKTFEAKEAAEKAGVTTGDTKKAATKTSPGKANDVDELATKADPQMKSMISTKPGEKPVLGRPGVINDIEYLYRDVNTPEDEIVDILDELKTMSDKDLLLEREGAMSRHAKLKATKSATDKVDEEIVGELDELAARADQGDKYAAKEMNKKLPQSPLMPGIVEQSQKDTSTAAKWIKSEAKSGLGIDIDGPLVQQVGIIDDLDVLAASISQPYPKKTPKDIRLNYARMDNDEQMNAAIDEILDIYREEFNRARATGRVKDEDFSDFAQRVKFKSLFKRDPGPLIAEDAYALRMLARSAALNVGRAGKWARKAKTETAEFYYDKAMEFARKAMREDVGRASESGRSLRAYKLAAEDEPTLVKRIQRSIYNRKYDKDRATIQKMVATFDDPTQLQKFLMLSFSGKATGDFIYTAYIHSLLSAGVTHMTNLVTSSFMTVLNVTDEAVAALPALGTGRPRDAKMHLQSAKVAAVAGIAALPDAFRIARTFNRYQDTLEAIVKGTEMPKKPVIPKDKYPQRLYSKEFDSLGDALGHGHGSAVEFQGSYMDTIIESNPWKAADDPLVVTGKHQHVTAYLPGDILRRGDFFVKTMQYAQGRNILAVRKLYRSGKPFTKENLIKSIESLEPDDIMAAIEFAERGTFQAELGQFGKLVTAATKMQPAPGVPAAKWIFPFIRTPVNLVKVGIEYSPFGGGTAIAKGLKHGVGAEWDVSMARALTGIGIMGVLASLLDTDSITGRGGDPGSPTEHFNKTYGRPPNSIKLFGKWYSYDWFEPLKFAIGLVANYKEAAESIDLSTRDGWDTLNALFSATVAGFMEVTIDENYINNLNNLILMLREVSEKHSELVETEGESLFDDKISIVGKTMTQVGAVMVPNFLHQLNRKCELLGFGDDTFRMASTFQEKIMSRLPGFSKSLSPHIDFYGNPARQPEMWGPNFFFPVRVREAMDENDLVTVELANIKPKIPRVGRTISGVELSHEQFSRMLTIIGKGHKKLGMPSKRKVLETLIKSKKYKKLSKEGKRTFLRLRLTQQNDAGRKAIVVLDKELQQKIRRFQELEQEKLLGPMP